MPYPLLSYPTAELAPLPGETPHSNKAKLPRLSLPSFSGNVTKWTTFWDSCESAVHKNENLTDIDKFNYLRSLLEHTAYKGYIWSHLVLDQLPRSHGHPA